MNYVSVILIQLTSQLQEVCLMHQYLFYIGQFPVRAYGLVLSLSIILATGVGYFLATQDGR